MEWIGNCADEKEEEPLDIAFAWPWTSRLVQASGPLEVREAEARRHWERGNLWAVVWKDSIPIHECRSEGYQSVSFPPSQRAVRVYVPARQSRHLQKVEEPTLRVIPSSPVPFQVSGTVSASRNTPLPLISRFFLAGPGSFWMTKSQHSITECSDIRLGARQEWGCRLRAGLT